MATYGVDIEIGVKGQQRLQSLTSAIKLSGKAADSLAASLGERGVVSQSIDNYNKALRRASRTLQGVIAGTQAETKAVKEYAAALSNLIGIQERQKRLVGAEFRATAAGQAELELTKAKKSLEIKRKQGELQRQQDRDREAIQKALGRMEFEQAARRRELLAQGTRELKEQLELSRQIFQTTTSGAPTTISRTVQKRPTFGGGAATAFGPQPDRIKRLRRAEIFDRTAAARRENEERRRQFLKLEETARGARIKAAREENRNAQQLIVTKKDELALQKRLGEMEKRSQDLADRKNKSLRHSFRLGKSIVRETVKGVNADKARTKELEKQNALARQQRNQRLRSAVGSGLIGGGFPLLFGQTGAAAVGGALGGLGGGLIGGEFGFALSVVGTAIGQAVAEAEEFDKALAAVNATARSLGSAAHASAEDIKDLAKQLGITKDEALELVGAFSAFESFADKKALTAIFGDDPGAFNRLAAATKEFELAKEIFATRDKIGNLKAKGLLNMLKIADASVVELALVEARLKAEHDISVEKAKQITFMDRLNAAAVTAGMAGLGGGVIDPAEFGRERAEELEADFIADREKFLQTFRKLLKERRELLASVNSFDPGKPDKPAKPRIVSGEFIEQSLRRQLARYEEIEPFARKIAIIEADHKVTLERIAKVTDETHRGVLATLADKVKTARLDDVEAQKIEQRGRDAAKLLREQKKLREEILQVQQEELQKAQDMAKALSDTVKEGFVDGIKAATSETRTLSDALANMLNRLSDQLLNIAANMAFYGNMQGNLSQGQGLIGSLLGSIAPSLFNATSTAGPGGYRIPDAAVPKFRANGGGVGAGRPYIVGERGPELFVPGAQGNIVPNNAMGGSNIVVNVDASGSSVEGDSQQAAQLGKMLGAVVQAELVKQKRPGGLLAS